MISQFIVREKIVLSDIVIKLLWFVLLYPSSDALEKVFKGAHAKLNPSWLHLNAFTNSFAILKVYRESRCENLLLSVFKEIALFVVIAISD